MSNYTDTLQRGDKIGCYRIEEVLGRGGFAVTYLATDENLDVEVAIKEYLPREITQRDENLQVSPRKQEFAEDYTVGLENFAREAKTLARFKHPHIVRVHQVLHANNTAYMVMDFEHGQELAEVLESGSLPEEELRAILFPILDGVEEIHRHGFVHRDIKPSNIYVRHNGSPVLIDFGAARYTMSETTQQLTAVVTVGYTPIEQYNVSEDSQGAWSDIYALAAVCYEAVTGEVPTDSVTRASASVTQGDDPLPSVRDHAKQRYSDDCLDAIDWGLRMDAEDRPQVIAQWRDSFDGIFNPASAYMTRKENESIYSQAPVASRVRNDVQHRSASNDNLRDAEVSVPLHQTVTPLDAEVVSLHTDSNRDSRVSSMHPVAPDSAVSTHNADTDPVSRNLLRRDSNQINRQSDGAPENTVHELQSAPKPKRSKFERPTQQIESSTRPKRTLDSFRDEIEFDESDWDYEPPKQPSTWRLVVPAIGLAAVVGVSIAYVNFPEFIQNLGNRGQDLTTEQRLELANRKMASSEYLFPEGESALDYFQQVLDADPNNAMALKGKSEIEIAVREKIALTMENNNLSEANRLVARAEAAQLRNIYQSKDASMTAVEQVSKPEASSQPTSDPVQSQGAIVTPVDTASIQPTTTSTQAEEIVASVSSRPNTGIDNNISPFIQNQITKLESLIEEKDFTGARALFNDTDKFIPDPSLSRRLLLKIEAGEDAAEAALLASNASTAIAPTPSVIAPPVPQPTPEPAPVPQATPEPVVTTTITPDPAPAPAPVSVEIVATGSTTEHLNQLKSALEAKSMESVVEISDSFPASRTQFLTRLFNVYDRIDVTIDDVNESGNSLSAKLNVSMFNRGDDGSFYSAGKWSGVTLNATRENGVWEKIRW